MDSLKEYLKYGRRKLRTGSKFIPKERSNQRNLFHCSNNQIYQELTTEEHYFKNSSNEILYIDLKDSKGYTGDLGRLRSEDSNVSLHVTLKSVIGEYIYTLTGKCLALKHKTNNIA